MSSIDHILLAVATDFKPPEFHMSESTHQDYIPRQFLSLRDAET